jgi:hypothetical protein
MRGAALLVPIALVVSSCSDDNDRTYAFDETVRCLRDAGYRVDEGGEPTPPTPDTRDAIVSRAERLAFSLVFHESVERAKEIFSPPAPRGSGLALGAQNRASGQRHRDHRPRPRGKAYNGGRRADPRSVPASGLTGTGT